MNNELDLIFPEWDVPNNIRAFSTVRYGGVSQSPYHGKTPYDGGLNLAMHVGDNPIHVEQNRKRLKKLLPKNPLWLNQIHGSTVVKAEEIKNIPDADACISTTPSAVCIIQTADCLPVIFCDSSGFVVGAAHAGWRGLAKGILEETLKQMRNVGAKKIQAWMGPAIGPNHFEVGEDVLESFSSQDSLFLQYFKTRPNKQNKYLANIYGLARHILTKQGVTKISGGNFCTVSDISRFYSYRRDGITGRMATCIWIN